MLALDRIVCVDWAKEHRRRRAWVAEIGTRRVSPLDVEPSLEALLAHARGAAGRTLVGIDAVLGVPRRYLEAARASVSDWRAASDFLTWLSLTSNRSDFGDACRSAAEWRHDRPFIAVPAGAGALTTFWTSAGGRLMRDIDVATGAKSAFVVSGIPGTVGSGTRALWCELVPLLGGERDFAVWPFDGALRDLEQRVVIGEIYPRICYSLALSDALPAAMMPLGKTSRDVRVRAAAALSSMAWVHERGVTLDALDRARRDEDDFDAMMSATALLRCVIDGHPLEQDGDPTSALPLRDLPSARCARFRPVPRGASTPPMDPIEGGILGMASIRSGSSR